MARRLFKLPALLLIFSCATGCDSSSPSAPATPPPCGGYPLWQTAPWVLPYAVGSAHTVTQDNCTPIGLSGNSGYTLNLPHLHFHVAPCSFYENCGTVPVAFRNTAATRLA